MGRGMGSSGGGGRGIGGGSGRSFGGSHGGMGGGPKSGGMGGGPRPGGNNTMHMGMPRGGHGPAPMPHHRPAPPPPPRRRHHPAITAAVLSALMGICPYGQPGPHCAGCSRICDYRWYP